SPRLSTRVPSRSKMTAWMRPIAADRSSLGRDAGPEWRRIAAAAADASVTLRAMEYRNLGSAGVKVSSLCLGAMTFGEADEKSFMHEVGADEVTSHAILDRALDAGINFIDTADVYGQDGLSERVIGGWFGQGSKRDRVVLATKFRFTMGDGPNRSGAS